MQQILEPSRPQSVIMWTSPLMFQKFFDLLVWTRLKSLFCVFFILVMLTVVDLGFSQWGGWNIFPLHLLPSSSSPPLLSPFSFTLCYLSD